MGDGDGFTVDPEFVGVAASKREKSDYIAFQRWLNKLTHYAFSEEVNGGGRDKTGNR